MADRPIRIQLRRTKGWKMPANTVKVSRPSLFGNPFTMHLCREAGHRGTDAQIAARCAEAYRAWLGPHWRDNWHSRESEMRRTAIIAWLPTLRGKNLACWCPLDQPCHADVLLELANAEVRP